jgi:hypothetical protein
MATERTVSTHPQGSDAITHPARHCGSRLRIASGRLFGPLLLPMVLAAGGCSVANQAIRADFTDYNAIIQFNQTQQMLLNLVRLHYRESPMFLQAGALSASYESRAAANAGYSVESGVSLTRGVELNYDFASKPTITYTPIEGKSYVQQFMSEISLETFGLLLRSRWSVTKLCDLLVERVGVGQDAARNDSQSPSYPRFVALVESLQEAQDAGQLQIVADKGALVVRAGRQVIPAEALMLRSLFDVMFFAARNTETPSEHQGRARPSQANGALTIHASSSRPPDAMVWVEYAGHYYSIDNTDLHSKDTFALLIELSRIQASPAAGSPVLTLPVR